MRALKFPAKIDDDHTLHIRLPEGVAAGVAEVIVLLPEVDDREGAAVENGTVNEFLASRALEGHLHSQQAGSR